MLIKQIISAAKNCKSEENAQELLGLLTEDLVLEISSALDETRNNDYWSVDGKYVVETELQHIFSSYFGLSLYVSVGREVIVKGESKTCLEARIETVRFKDEGGDASREWEVFIGLEDNQLFYEDSTVEDLSNWVQEKLIAQYESMLTACGVSSIEAQKLAKDYWTL